MKNVHEWSKSQKMKFITFVIERLERLEESDSDRVISIDECFSLYNYPNKIPMELALPGIAEGLELRRKKRKSIHAWTPGKRRGKINYLRQKRRSLIPKDKRKRN